MATPKFPEPNRRSVPASVPPAVPAAPAPAAPVPPLFRRVDWLALLLTFAAVGVVYFLTLAPELTLEDSGELVTGSFYAGIPHPPGYPVWTIYSWLWTQLLPVGNMAWRVGVGQAFSAALACGLLAFVVSRGCSLLMESIEDLRQMTGKWENAICVVSGFVAGVLVGLDGFIWSESIVVNRIAVFSLPWFMLLLICLLRWLYSPVQMRYAYLAALLFGVCITIHQSLVVAAIGIEVVVAMGNPRLGRNAFLGNFIIYVIDMAIFEATGHHLLAILAKPGMFVIFNLVGIGSAAAGIWLAIKTEGLFKGWLPILAMFGLFFVGVSFYFYMPLSGMTNPPMQWGYPRTVEGFFHALSRGQYEQPNPTDLLKDPMRFFGQLGMVITGVADEFTWVYMFVALVPFAFFLRMKYRERAWLTSLAVMYLCTGVLLIILLNPTPDRASADLVRVFLTSSHLIVACLIGYGLGLTAAFMATHYRRFRWYGIAGGGVAVLLALYCLWDGTGKAFFGRGGQVPIGELPHWIAQAFAPQQFGLSVFANLLLVGLALAFVVALLVYRQRGPLLITLGLYTLMPVYSGLDHWFDSEQRDHFFGYWFGHDMFTPPFKDAQGKPLYPPMTRNAVLFGGTDPGRFCPTYMIFCESFTPHACQPLQDQKFDRRDVYIITQNALADPTYLCYIRAHYNRSTQIDPPFFSEFARMLLKDPPYQTNLLARMVSPLDSLFTELGRRVEKRRRTYTSWFGEKDFTDMSALTLRLSPGPNQDPLSKFISDNLSAETRRLLAEKKDSPALRSALAEDLNRLLDRDLEVQKRIAALQQEKDEVDQRIADAGESEKLRHKSDGLAGQISELSRIEPLYVPEHFKQVQLPEYLRKFIQQNPRIDSRVRLNRLLLEAAYPNALSHTIGGVYPDREIYIPTIEDSQQSFQDYSADAARRMQHDMQFPNEPRQLRQGEDVQISGDKASVVGQTAVMGINGLIAKVIFDKNPENEFFVEESFPLDWMYPYLTPYGIIMKINRHPLTTLDQETLTRDHEFWKQYSKRLTGDIMDYDTPMKDVVAWIEKSYLRRNFEGFTGDRKFIRDDDGQKAFSKLRSSIGGIYAWRLGPQCPAKYRPKTQAEFQRIYREADFALKQSFVFCPYSLEAVWRYAMLLLQFNRVDDAILVAETCKKFDPFNKQISEMLETFESIKHQGQSGIEPGGETGQSPEEMLRKDPNNVSLALGLASACFQGRQFDQAQSLLDRVLQNPKADVQAILQVAQGYVQLSNWSKVGMALDRLVKLDPSNPEAWYDLAALRASLGAPQESLTALRKALELNKQRHIQDPSAPDLATLLRQDQRFIPIQKEPEFQKLVR